MISNLAYFNGIATHQQINKASYMLAFGKLKDVNLFPNYRKINFFSNVMNPDLINWRGKNRSSLHSYNPNTKKGGATKVTQKYYNKLVKELIKPHPKYRRAAFFASWMMHYCVDALNPAHQIGYKRKDRKLLDWEDPGYGAKLYIIQNILKHHLAFELRVVWHYIFKSFPKAKIDDEFVLPTVKKFNKRTVRRYVEKNAAKMLEYRIYNLYRKKGWTPEVRSLVHEKMLPMMISTTSTLIKAAQLEAVRIKYQNLAGRIFSR